MAEAPKKKIVIAVFNSSDEVLQIIAEALEMHGYAAVTGHVDDIRRGRLDLIAYLSTHDPTIVVWDIGPPYLENWRLLQLVRHLDLMQGRGVIVTTTNKRSVAEQVGANDVIELLDRPFGLDELLDRIQKLTGTRAKVLGHAAEDVKEPPPR